MKKRTFIGIVCMVMALTIPAIGIAAGFDVYIATAAPVVIQEPKIETNFDLSYDVATAAPVEIEDVNVDVTFDAELDLATAAPVEIKVAPIEIDLGAALQFAIPPVTEYVPIEIGTIYTEMLPYMSEVDLAELSGMTEIEAAEFAQLQFEVVQLVAQQFQAAGFDAVFDTNSGIITIDSSLLYDTDKYEVTEKGKATIKTVMEILCSVLTMDEYRDSVSAIVIAGHTDSVGSHEYNQQLSERRANAVKDYCLSAECGLEDALWLSDVLVAKGYSYDHLIYDANGNEDKAASRRVEMRFIMKVS